MKSRLYEYDKIINNQRKSLEEYQKLNAVEKYLKKMKKQKLQEVKPVLFVVQYKDIGMPFQKLDVFRRWCNHELYNASVDPIPDPNIDNLWTIVQYEGDGVFTDLTTDKKFKLAHYEEYIKERLSLNKIKTVKDFNDVSALYEDLIKTPLGISDESKNLDKNSNIVYSSPLHELTIEIEMKVVKETMPRKDIIEKAMSRKEEIARRAIIEKYGSLYHQILIGNVDSLGEENINKRI